MNNNENGEKKKESLSPRELIHRHSDHPDEPIINENIENLDLTDSITSTKSNSSDAVELTSEEKTSADELADNLSDDNTGMSYKADL